MDTDSGATNYGMPFAMGKLGDHYIPPATADAIDLQDCKWILSVCNKAIGKTVTSTNCLVQYQL